VGAAGPRVSTRKSLIYPPGQAGLAADGGERQVRIRIRASIAPVGPGSLRLGRPLQEGTGEGGGRAVGAKEGTLGVSRLAGGRLGSCDESRRKG
jgi:hypothetical protein